MFHVDKFVQKKQFYPLNLILLRSKYIKGMKAYIFSDKSLLGVLIRSSVGGDTILQTCHGLEFGALEQVVFV